MPTDHEFEEEKQGFGEDANARQAAGMQVWTKVPSS